MFAGLIIASIIWLIWVIFVAGTLDWHERMNYQAVTLMAVCTLLTGGLLGSAVEWLIGVLA